MIRSSIPSSLSKPHLDYTSSFAHLHLCRSQQLHPAVTPLTIYDLTCQRRKPDIIQSTSTCLPPLFPSCPFHLPLPLLVAQLLLPRLLSCSFYILSSAWFHRATLTSHAYATSSGNTHSTSEAARPLVEQATIPVQTSLQQGYTIQVSA